MRQRAARKARAVFGRARETAEQVRHATGEVAQHLRQLGRKAAQSDIARMVMARLPEHLIRRQVASVVYRDQAAKRQRGPLPDPSWTAGYADVAAVRVAGFARQPERVAPTAEARPVWPFAGVEAGDDGRPDPEAGQ
jgi:hypothetical protein